jgi:hypothetical protein
LHNHRIAVPSVLGPPNHLELNLANQNNPAIGWSATVTAVDFMRKSNDCRQIEVLPVQPEAGL